LAWTAERNDVYGREIVSTHFAYIREDVDFGMMVSQDCLAGLVDLDGPAESDTSPLES
jgi:hypothetical protein